MPHAEPRDPRPVPGSATATPPALVTAASLVGVQGFLLLAFGAIEAADGGEVGLSAGPGTAVVLLAAGAGLVACAGALWRGRRWARGPALLAQLVALGLAWNLRSDATVLAVGLAALALVVVAGVLHPASVDVLEQRGPRD